MIFIKIIHINFQFLAPLICVVGVTPLQDLLGSVGDLYCFSNTFKMLVHFVFCRFRGAPSRSTGPIQMKSRMTFILGIKVHRKNEHLKEKWRRYYSS